MDDFLKTVMETVTWLDIACIVLLLIFIIRGAWIGLIRQVAAFLALVGSYVVTALYLPRFLPTVSQYVDNPRMVFLVGFVVLFLFSALCFTLIGKILSRLVEVVFLAGWFDRFLGALLGVVKALILASLAYMVLAATISPDSPLLKKSWSTPVLREGARVLQAIIHDEKLKGYFKEKMAAIPLPGSGPDKTNKASGNAQPGAQQPAAQGGANPQNAQPAPPTQGNPGWEPNRTDAPQSPAPPAVPDAQNAVPDPPPAPAAQGGEPPANVPQEPPPAPPR